MVSVIRTRWSFTALVLAACQGDAPAADGTGTGEATTGSTSSAGGSSTSVASTSSESASSSSDDGADTSSTGDPMAVDCTDACIDVASDAGIALCHSCRCKVAFDNWLPSVDEVQCSTAAPIVTYHADLSTDPAVLEPAPEGAITCANPSLLTSSCKQGSRLGQLQHGDVMLRWICRDPEDDGGSTLYYDMGLIGQNVRTGATCFWDDVDFVTHDDDMPPLDLMEASAEQRARHTEVFYHTAGQTCVGCHDHDPFVYTPYLQSTPWLSVAIDKGPYWVVDLDGGGHATGNSHLVSPEANACTSCHRMGSAKTCGLFAGDSLAQSKGAAYEQSVHDAAMPGSPHWRLAYWMPNGGLPIADFDVWTTLFSGAREHILGCCAAPGVDVGGCVWEPVPTE
ncbi:MAG: hypothetical protein IAG13_00340 [Deltaproteobacteria bacterium]|nr:hypothetical protein [Nannocystaceae bacterium]